MRSTEAAKRVERLTEQIRTLLPEWKMAPVVEALQALRGVSLITAVITVAEIGDLTRFENPRQLMAYLGLVPSEHSSGANKRAWSDHQGWQLTCQTCVGRECLGISSARTSDTHHPTSPREALEAGPCHRQDALSFDYVLGIVARSPKGKTKQQIVTAIARELAAFMWAIACEVQAAGTQLATADRTLRDAQMAPYI